MHASRAIRVMCPAPTNWAVRIMGPTDPFSSEIAVEDEASPVERARGVRGGERFTLGPRERTGDRRTRPEPDVEARHQPGGGAVIHRPERGEHALGAGRLERLYQPHPVVAGG